MDTPQEPAGAHVIPLFPEPDPHEPAPPDTAPAPGDNELSSAPSREAADRLLGIEAMSRALPGEERGMSHMRAVELAVSSGAFYPHLATENVPAAAAKLGIRTIEVMLQTRGEYEPEFIDRLATNARAAGVTIHALHTMAHLHPMMNAYPRRADEGRSLFQQGIDAAVALGAEVIVWHGPNRHEVATDAQWERFLQLTRDLAQACGRAGITLALENVSICALSHVRHVVNFARRLAEIGSPREVGFVFDPFQAAEAGANPFMMLAAMGNRIVDVHISDHSERDGAARHLPPGDGDLPWPALIRAIAGSGYSGPMMIEGPLGDSDEVITRIRQRFNPWIRSVFPFSPDAHRYDDDHAGSLPDGIREGIELFNKRRFFEQHEVIEHEWHAERGPIRRLYQGILQIGIGFYHALNGNYRGAVSLLTDGIEKTSDFLPGALGIDTQKLVAESRHCLDQIMVLGADRIGAFDASCIPVIELDNT